MNKLINLYILSKNKFYFLIFAYYSINPQNGMKALFLVFHGFLAHNGISKKIFYQVDGMRQCGVDTKLSYLFIDKDGFHKRMADDTVIKNYGKGFLAKIKKRICYESLLKYILNEKIELVYVRYVHNANPALIHLFKSLKKEKVKVVMEIPTYPYDQEYKGLSMDYQRILFFDRCFRQTLAREVYKIVTFSDYTEIWGKPTIRISNGIDFEQIKIKTNTWHNPREFHLIGVATIHPWHGFDRLIAGLINYYKENRSLKLFFHIVGEGVPEIVEEYRQLVDRNNISNFVIFHGPKFGEELDAIFEQSDLGIGSLARHRSNITKIKTLKNREYAARGIPFIYSEIDDDFENMPYILKVPADDTPIDIEAVINFYSTNSFIPSEIRTTIEGKLSWKEQMQVVFNNIGRFN